MNVIVVWQNSSWIAAIQCSFAAEMQTCAKLQNIILNSLWGLV